MLYKLFLLALVSYGSSSNVGTKRSISDLIGAAESIVSPSISTTTNTNITSTNKPKPSYRTEAGQVIPAGLYRSWNFIIDECKLFNEPTQKDIIKHLLIAIAQDDVIVFKSLEQDFIKAFNTDYKGMILEGRSVLSWLIILGAVQIIRNIDVSQYNIDLNQLGDFLKQFLGLSSIFQTAQTLNALPFLAFVNFSDSTFLVYCSSLQGHGNIEYEREYLVEILSYLHIEDYHFHQILSAPCINYNLTSLLSVVQETLNDIYLHDRKERFKCAFHVFVSKTVSDFSSLEIADLFSMASLFIKYDDEVGLNRVLMAKPELNLASQIGNYKTLLHNCIEKDAIKCAQIIISYAPQLITTTGNNYQSPLLQVLKSSHSAFLDLFLQIPGVSSSALNVIIEEDDFEILKTSQSLSKYITKDTIMEIFVNSTTKISNSFWSFILDHLQISVNEVFDLKGKSLLDIAVINNNPDIMQRLVEEFSFNINYNCQVNGANLHGNALRFVDSDTSLLVLEKLVNLGININDSIIEFVKVDMEDEGVLMIQRKERPMIDWLVSSYQLRSLVEKLPFSKEAANLCLKFCQKRGAGDVSIPKRILSQPNQKTKNE